jgi:TolA-binding protein
MGTVAYMSPEQARGEELDARSDLFSFGVVLYEMATGQQTFQGGTTALVFDAILNRDPRAPIELNANVPAALERVIARALDKDRSARYQTVADMRDDLQRIARERDSATSVAVAASATRVPVASRASWPSSVAVAAAVPAPVAAVAPVVRVRERRTPRSVLVPAAAVALAVLLLWRWIGSDNQIVVNVPAPTPAAAPALTSVAPGATTAVAIVPAAPAAATPAPGRASVASPSPAKPSPPGAPATAPATAAVAVATAPVAGARGEVPSRLKAAQAKFDSGLFDQALADARDMVAAAPTSASAPAARLLIARTLERQRKPDDAMAAYVELRTTHKAVPEAATATLALAELVLRSKQKDREQTARTLFDEVATGFPASAEAPTALVRRASLEEKGRTRVIDKELGTSVPPELMTYRTVVEKYPSAPAAEVAHEKLAGLYEDLKRYEHAARTWESLAANFPKNRREGIWRAAELYREKLKDPARAKDAYARVPAGSSRYSDAQERLR